MKIQFDWRFDEDATEEENRVTSPRDPIESSLMTHFFTSSTVRAGRTRSQVWLTRSQRRLHSTLARTKPWLCPAGEPEPFVHSSGWRKRITRIPVIRIRRRPRRRPGQISLTRRQRRLHAALARTRPWLCPYPRPE